jgi:hypothetical protein
MSRTQVNQSNENFALVIGNGYTGSDRVSGKEDATAMTGALKALGFSIVTVLDGDVTEIKNALTDFRKQIAKAKVVLFFYSGHGYQLSGANYLLPVGSTIDPAKPEISLDKVVLRSLSGAPDGAVKLVFLDACRTNADLPVVGGKKLKTVPGWKPGLAKAQQGVPPSTLFGYAATYGQPAVSGNIGGLSPYTSVLLGSIREPGLEIRDLLARVHDQVFAITQRQQSPKDEGIGGLPTSFYLSKPVFVHAIVPEDPNDDLLVFLNGKIALNAPTHIETDFKLNAGDNELVLMVARGKTYHNNHDWDRPEGWKYRLDLVLPDGRKETFEGHEDTPFKDGPHQGRVFEVARILINVDPISAATAVTARDTDVWNRESLTTPRYALNQELLFETSIASLNLTPEDILSGAVDLGGVAAILRPFLIEFLKSGTVLGQTIADPNHTFINVWGNRELKTYVQTAMIQGRDDRIRDLKDSITEVFKRNPTPFKLFDQRLIEAVQKAAAGSGIPVDAIRVWTALHDSSDETPAVAASTNAEAGMIPALVQ